MTRVSALAVALVVSVGCAARISGESLGGSYTRVREETQSSSASEDIRHADRLYFHGADLGEVGFVSVAPSGGYAIFERNGEIYLIVSATGNLTPVTDGEFSIPRTVQWHESEMFAEIEYYDAHLPSRIALR